MPVEMTFSLRKSKGMRTKRSINIHSFRLLKYLLLASPRGIAVHFLEAAESLATQRGSSSHVFSKLEERKVAEAIRFGFL